MPTATRKRFMLPAAAAAALLLLAAAVRAAPAPSLEPSLAEVLVTAQEYDPFVPWQKRPPRQRAGFAVAVAPDLLLTTERLVRNHTLVELRLPRSARKVPAVVALADIEIGLALLRVDGPEPRFEPLQPDPGALRRPDAPLSLAQLDANGEAESGEVTLRRLAVDELPGAPHPALLATIGTEIDVEREGAAVLRDGRLAGLVLAAAGSRTATMLPASILARFLEDAATPPYEGFAMAGFLWAPLVDPTERRYFGVPADGGGIQVLAALPGTGAAEVLQAHDVILEWDGAALDAQGFYEDPELGRLQFSQRIKFERRTGDTVPVQVVRDGTATNLTLRLGRFRDDDALIPENLEGRAEPYLVEGGLIFRELTGHYLKARGAEWMGQTNPRLAQLYNTRRYEPERPGQHVIVLSAVLPDLVNVDYTGLRDEIVTAVNGEPVDSLADLFERLGDTGRVTRVRMEGIEIDLALDAGTLPAANARIARQYRLPALRRAPAPAAANGEPEP